MRQIGAARFQGHAGRIEPRDAAACAARAKSRACRATRCWRGTSSRSRTPRDRRLVVQFNQPQKDQFALQVQMQTPLGAFPQTADAMQLRPEGATRFAGYFRIVNEGAVRLEVAQASGLSQISPEQFPESDATTRAVCARPAASGLPIVFPARISPCASRRTKFCPNSRVSAGAGLSPRRKRTGDRRGDRTRHPRSAVARIAAARAQRLRHRRLTASGLSDYFLREPRGPAGRRTAPGLWPADFRPASGPTPSRTQQAARRNELDAAAHRSAEGQIRARPRRRLGGRGFSPHARSARRR